MSIEWTPIEDGMPPKRFGWFVVATLPRNHSGKEGIDMGSLKGDNEWRDSFGFTKAWLNNGQWWEPNPHGMRSDDITEYVTHWAECPKVPVLTQPHKTTYKGFSLYDKPNKEAIIKLAGEQWEQDQKTNPTQVNPHAFNYGFYSAFAYMGMR